MLFTHHFPSGTPSLCTLESLVRTSKIFSTDREITSKEKDDIRASWNLPAPVTPPEVEGLVKALEDIAGGMIGNDAAANAAIDSGDRPAFTAAMFRWCQNRARAALATYRARLTPPPAPGVTGGGT